MSFLDTVMATTGSLFSGLGSGGFLQGVQSKLPANGILSQRIGVLNTRIAAAKASPSIMGKIQAFAMPTGGGILSQGGLLSGIKKEVFTQVNTNVPPPLPSSVTPQTQFILK